MSELTPSQIVGIVGGILGALIGISGGIIGWLCTKNRTKYQSLLMGFLITIISLGAVSLLAGICLYIANLSDPVYSYSLVSFGGLIIFIGSFNFFLQKRTTKQIEELKDNTIK